MNIKFDLSDGCVFIDSKAIEIDECGKVSGVPPELMLASNILNCNELEWYFNQSFITLGSPASLVIRSNRKKITSICVLFSEICFFESSILESKIVKRFEKKYGIRVTCPHPAVADIGSFNWGRAEFSYDPKQGDMSLCLFYS